MSLNFCHYLKKLIEYGNFMQNNIHLKRLEKSPTTLCVQRVSHIYLHLKKWVQTFPSSLPIHETTHS